MSALVDRMNSMTAHMDRLMSSLPEKVVQSMQKTRTFSGVSQSIVNQTLSWLEVEIAGTFKPDLSSYMPATVEPYKWTQTYEKIESSLLLSFLKSKVISGEQYCNNFRDVQCFSKYGYVEMNVEGIARFTGVPDAIIGNIGIDENSIFLTNNECVWIDWKTPVAMNDKTKINAIGRIQAIAWSSNVVKKKNRVFPVIHTDMERFRCWLCCGEYIYDVHTQDHDLGLEEGIALIRYFLSLQKNGKSIIIGSNGVPEEVERSNRLETIHELEHEHEFPGDADNTEGESTNFEGSSNFSQRINQLQSFSNQIAPYWLDKFGEPYKVINTTDDLKNAPYILLSGMEAA